MPERRSDDTQPLVPRRTLSGPADDSRAPLSERVSAALAAAGQVAQTAATGTEPRTAPAKRPTPPTQSPAPRAEASPAPAASNGATAAPAANRGPRKARLRLTHVDPMSVAKTAFLLSVAIGVVTVIAVAIVWGVLGAAGVWDSINKTVVDVVGNDGTSNFDVRDYLGTGRVMGFTMLVSVVDVILITAIATLGAFLYNLAAALLGGIEVTLAEDDH
jgi:Transmembrane domain of unknown function (DUF3566)